MSKIRSISPSTSIETKNEGTLKTRDKSRKTFMVVSKSVRVKLELDISMIRNSLD